MKILARLFFVFFILPNLAACGLASPGIYSFHGSESNPAKFSSIKAESHRGEGVLIIRALDGKDTKTHPQIAEQIKANPGAPNIEPRYISVAPGAHSVGVLYIFTDVSNKLLTTKLAKQFQKEYLPDNPSTYTSGNSPKFITIKHFEELTFQCKAASIYIIDRSWDEAAAQISFSVRECDSAGNNCAVIDIQRNKVKSTAVPGVSMSDI